MYKSFKLRLLPSEEQKTLIHKSIGCSRFIYNWALAIANEHYKATGKHLSEFNLCNRLTLYKKCEDVKWLNEINRKTLTSAIKQQSQAWDNFFKNPQHFNIPKFKSKKRAKRIFNLGEPKRTHFNQDKTIKLPKFKQPMCYKCKRLPEEVLTNRWVNLTIVHRPNNKFILTITYELSDVREPSTLRNVKCGIDVGLKSLATVQFSDGQTLSFKNINKTKRVRKLESKLRHIQRNLARKYKRQSKKQSRNYWKETYRLREIHYRLTNIRTDHINQSVAHIIKQRPQQIVVEDLNVLGLMKNKHLAKQVQDQKLGLFLEKAKAKCEYHGIELVKADRYYPSSKTCSKCGHIHRDLKLSDRVYECPECGFREDRDVNAAINLMNYTSRKSLEIGQSYVA